jgi:hypothetical protein
MAFFCPQSGVRVVAPGNCLAVDPKGVAVFDDSDAARAAEFAALASLAKSRQHANEAEPSMDARRLAQEAAAKAIEPEPAKVDEKHVDAKEAAKPNGGRRPKPSEAVEA